MNLWFDGQIILCVVVWALVFLYVGGPRLDRWLPWVAQWRYRLPWKRKRYHRDFSTLLALLLDSGVPESDAVTLAAEGTANRVVQARASVILADLRNGIPLTKAIQNLDETGEFAWRLSNAKFGQGGFSRALTAWHESLDAQAFQQEQAAAQYASTAVILWGGLVVGTVVVAMFGLLIDVINQGVLW